MSKSLLLLLLLLTVVVTVVSGALWWRGGFFGSAASVERMECAVASPRSGQRIEQIFIADYLKQYFESTILSNTHLHLYNDTNRPAFFYGLATDATQLVLHKHRSFAVVIMTGGDSFDTRPAALKLFGFLKASWFTKAVAISKFIRETLTKHKVSHVYSPFYPLPVDESVEAVPKGGAVCMYGLPDKIYHNDKVRSIIQPRFPDLEFIYFAHQNPPLPVPFQHFPKEQMNSVLRRCFLGIRLTTNDGLAGVVQELGVLGVKTVWNGGTPSSIPWKSMDDVVRVVEEERKTIGVAFLFSVFFSISRFLGRWRILLCRRRQRIFSKFVLNSSCLKRTFPALPTGDGQNNRRVMKLQPARARVLFPQ